MILDPTYPHKKLYFIMYLLLSLLHVVYLRRWRCSLVAPRHGWMARLPARFFFSPGKPVHAWRFANCCESNGAGPIPAWCMWPITSLDRPELAVPFFCGVIFHLGIDVYSPMWLRTQRGRVTRSTWTYGNISAGAAPGGDLDARTMADGDALSPVTCLVCLHRLMERCRGNLIFS
jgi:hypothetical protein